MAAHNSRVCAGLAINLTVKHMIVAIGCATPDHSTHVEIQPCQCSLVANSFNRICSDELSQPRRRALFFKGSGIGPPLFMPSVRGPLRVYYFAYFATMAVYLPFFPTWLKHQGIEGIRTSVLLALLPLMSVLGPAGFGILADTLGLRGRLLRIASLGAALSFVAVVVHSLMATRLAFEVAFLGCLGFAFFRTPMNLMADVVALEQGNDFARLRLWGSLGFMVAVPVIGRYLDFTQLWSLPLAMGGLLWVSHATTWFMPVQTRVPRPVKFQDVKQVFAEPGFVPFLLVVLLGQAAHVGYDMCLSLHFADLGISGAVIGWAWAIATGAEVIVMAYSPRFLKRRSAGSLLLLALCVQVGRWVFLASVTDHAWLISMQVMHALSFALRWIATMQIVSQYGHRLGAQATVQGFNLTANSIGSVLGMFLAGWLYTSHGGSGVFWASAGIAACAIPIVLLRSVQAGGMSEGVSQSRN
jgi:MFS transporter, PPP family, 3-phenylpropionic acid transporter